MRPITNSRRRKHPSPPADGNSLRYLDYYSNAIHGLRQYEPPPATETRSGALVGAAEAGGPDGN